MGSYAALRCGAMRWDAALRGRNHDRLVTWVDFGVGDNFAARVAFVVYFPLHRSEHALRLWMKQPVSYD